MTVWRTAAICFKKNLESITSLVIASRSGIQTFKAHGATRKFSSMSWLTNHRRNSFISAVPNPNRRALIFIIGF
jgi:hypothetical protein